MWEPVGPLPAHVYWRRRLVAIASTLVVLAACGWIAAATVAVPVAPTATQRLAAPASLATPDHPEAPADPAVVAPPPADPAVVATTSTPPPVERARPDATPAPEHLLPDDSPRWVGPAPTPVPVPATGPGPCDNAMLAVGAEIDRPAHRVGERPVLRLVVTNVSDQPCVRDLDPARQEIVVWGTDGARLWSSNDCSGAAGADLRTLVPGQPVVFSVTWAGRTSAAGCAGTRRTVPAGSYNVMTRVDDVISPPTPFTRAA